MKQFLSTTPAKPAGEISRLSRKDLAIIGMAGRLPLSANLDEFWENLARNQDCIIDFPANRVQDIKDYFQFKEIGYTESDLKFKRKGFLQEIAAFDFKFFNLTAKEAALMSPAQRIFLETAYHTVENAGYACKKLSGSKTGVFVGYTGGANNYLDLVNEAEPEFAGMAYPANLASIIASRFSYLFDLKGPSLLVDTACSSSMTAFNLACQSIREGACEMAIAGGINLSWTPFQENNGGLGILSRQERTQAFSEHSDGTVGGEGCVAFLLKPLNKAIRDKDHIHAIVKGIASNQDGSSIGITAPNALAQAEVIDSAWKDGQVDPLTISYIEAHGTGTALGDPIEIDGITRAFSKYTAKKQFCALSAVKTNIGHLNSVAGAAGIAKAVLSLKHKKIPALLHFQRPNSKINFVESPVYINTRLTGWTVPDGTPRRCGVSSFGMSGTNCHVVLEEAPAPAPVKAPAGIYLFALSARTETALTALINDYITWLDTKPGTPNIEDLCFTATTGRDHHPIRMAFTVTGPSDLRIKLTLLARRGAAGLECFPIPDDEKRRGLIADYLRGDDVDWLQLYAGRTPQRTELPLYPFDPKRCWVTYPAQKPAHPMDISVQKNNAEPAGAPETKSSAEIRELFNMQLQVMSRQLETMSAFYGTAPAAPAETAPSPESAPASISSAPTAPTPTTPSTYAPHLPAAPAREGLSPHAQEYLREFAAAYNRRTARSKENTQQYRRYYANNRYVANYNKEFKELTYPILVDEAKGSSITDIDGNSYLDFCMGFGVYLLGYSHPAVMTAIKTQADKGSYLGPMSTLPAEVARLICEMTGVERVAFYNSGTEAVMLALRLARAYTSRTKIVIFSGSYHGTYDGVLGQPDRFSKEFKAVPKSTGIPQSILDEVIMLDYGTPESLGIIRQHAHELAAVLVEPVQSRRPEFQPREYLHELRALTLECRIPLIFDEIITGFRIHPGGAQAYFGIQADLVTYGKIPGGGMPIGIIAGKAEFMHGVDGGVWQYGDDSHPKFDHRKAFVAGTFCHHPISMASAKAALLHMKAEGPALQENLNARTAAMAANLNTWFEQEGFEVRIVNFGSLFQIRTHYDLSLIVYHFLSQGIYAWEGMTFFISTAHSDEDVATFISVFKKTLRKLTHEGFITPKDTPPGIPLTDEQRRLWFMASGNTGASAAFNATRLVPIGETIDAPAFSAAFQTLLQRHEILRAVAIDGEYIRLGQPAGFQVTYSRINDEAGVEAFTRAEKDRPFDFANGPFIRIHVIHMDDNTSVCVLVVHQIIADGWSVNVILKELTALYEANVLGNDPGLPEPVSFSEYLHWSDHRYENDQEAKDYWRNGLQQITPPLQWPALADKNARGTFSGNSHVLKLDTASANGLAQLARTEGCTVFMVLLSLYKIFLNKITGSRHFVIGIPSAGQLNMEAEHLIGHCIRMLPLPVRIDDQHSFREFLHEVKTGWLAVYRYRSFPYERLAGDGGCELPAMDLVFNMDSPSSAPQETAGGSEAANDERRLVQKANDLNKYHVFLNVAKAGSQYKLTFQYNNALFDDTLMAEWLAGFGRMIDIVLNDRNITIGRIGLASTPHLSHEGLFTQLSAHEHLPQAFDLRGRGNTFFVPGGLAPALKAELINLGATITDPGAIRHEDDTLIVHSSLWNQWLNAGTTITSRLIVIGDSPLTGAQLDKWTQINNGTPFLFGFFSSTSSRVITRQKITAATPRKPVLPIGTLLDAGPYVIRDQDQNPVPPGIYGDLYTNGGKTLQHCRLLPDGQIEINFLTDKDQYAAVMATLDALGVPQRQWFLPEYLPATADPVTGDPAAGDLAAGGQTLTATQRTILDIFRSVLRSNKMGIHDRFFDEGGNSLKAVQILSRIHKQFNIRLPLRELFTNDTVQRLSAFVDKTDTGGGESITPVANQDSYPLSHAQKRLWILDQTNKGQTAYLINKSFHLDGPFNIDHFTRAVETLIQRHESLRTNFVVIDGEPRQKIHARRTPALVYLDIAGQEDGERQVQDCIRVETSTPFNLAADDLLRIVVIRTAETHHVIFLTIHHIIADGWSIEIILNELSGLYNSYNSGLPVGLAPLRIQYRDFAHWQNQQLNGPAAEEQSRYWLNKLRNFTPIELPLDRPRPLQRSEHGDRVFFDLGKELSEKIIALGTKHGSGAFSVLLSLTNLLLYKYSGQTDIILGSSTAGRDHVDLEDQIGIYANILVFRSQFNETNSFEQLLQITAATLLDAQDHQRYPFDKIVQDLGVRRDATRSAIYDVNIELDDVDVALPKEATPDSLATSYFDREMLTSKYDLSFRFNAGNTILGSIEYNTDLFDKATIQRMAGHLRQCALSALEHITAPLTALRCLDESEQLHLLKTAGDDSIRVPDSVSVMQRFEQKARRYADHPAVICGSDQLTYRQLNEKANALGAFLREKYHLGPNDRVGVMTDRSHRTIIALWGILKAGAAFVPIGPDLPPNRINYIIGDAGIRVLLTDSDYMFNLADNQDISLFVLDIELDLLADNVGNPPEAAGPNDLAYVLYTSGSTGNPKGVEIERRNLANYIHWTNAYYFENRPGKNFAFFTSLTFDLTITCIFSTLLRGDTVAVFGQKDIHQLLTTIFTPGAGVDVVKLTPSHISLLGYLDLSHTDVSQIIAGGEVLTSEQVAILRRLNPGIRIYNEYGPTEVTVGCIVKEIDTGGGPILIGRPISRTQVYILDSALNLVPPGAVGDLYIGGESVARGYLNNAAMTAKKFVKNPFGTDIIYDTGDRARRCASGEIEYLGRKDEQVKINGYRIELTEISSILAHFDGLDQAVVTTVQDKNGNPLLAAYFVAATPVDGKELAAFLKDSLPAWMIPSFFTQLPSIPLTGNGKVDKNALPDPLKDGRPLTTGFKDVENHVQARMADIWKRIFNLDRIGILDNFFELGGHSLKATQIIMEIFKEFGVNISLETIFMFPTIEGLAAKIPAAGKDGYLPIRRVEEQASYPASHAQHRIWLLSLLDNDPAAYVINDAFRLVGPIDVSAFTRVFRKLIARHESLRTTFVMTDGALRQVIRDADDPAFNLLYRDLRDQDDNNKLVTAEIRRLERTAFDLMEGPLVKTQLLQTSDREFVFLLTTHHIVSDGWSFEVMMKELTRLYQLETEGGEEPPPLNIQYKDYAAWHAEQLSGDSLQEYRNFYEEYLGRNLTQLEVPTDFPRGAVRTSNGGTVKFWLDPALSKKIRLLGQDKGCSLFMVLLTLIDMLLYRVTREKDITVGTAIAGRNHKDLEDQIGVYMNALPLRMVLDTRETAEDLLKRVKDMTLRVFKYQLYPLHMIVEDLEIERKPNRSPLFDIGITWQNQIGMNISPKAGIDGITVEHLADEGNIAKNDIWFYGSDNGESIGFRIRYNADLYKRETMEKLRTDFITICEAVTDNPRIDLDTLTASLSGSVSGDQLLMMANKDISENY